ncbi:MAG: CRTAC1 family protein [bacterium]|nr:CRTAC1 family protein [bacterium]
MRTFIFLFGVAVMFSCNSEKEFRSAETIEMAEYLSAKSDTARKSIAYPYYNDFLIKRIQHMLKGMPYRVRVGQRLDYGLALLMKGNNDHCIDEMTKAIEAFPQPETISSKNVYFYKVLALAHLRNGEQTNCINNHNAVSCVLPLAGGGIHQDKSGAELAMDIYIKLLEFDPKDYQSKWFLNLSFMALGKYPEEVPKNFLIEPSSYDSKIDFPAFQNVAMAAGVAVNNHAGSSVTEDFNNDGLIDIFTSSYSLSEQSQLFLNDGSGKFNDNSNASGLQGLTAGLNSLQGDFNNDGFEDILVSRGAWLGKNGRIRNSLLINVNGEKFEDRTLSSGLNSEKPTGAMAIADVDLDGDLDIFFGNEGSVRVPFSSELFLNDGKGNFKLGSIDIGLNINEFVKGANWGDINNDGYPDLLISIYGSPNRLYINRTAENGGNLSFEEIGQKAGISEPIFSFPCWFWDYNNDGLQDVLIFGYDNRRSQLIPEYVLKNMEDPSVVKDMPRLYKNNGDESFEDVTEEVGLNLPIYAMGANFGDLNNDGYPDFYAGTGEFNMWAQVPNKMFLNVEGKRFEEVTYAGGFGQIQKGHGVSFADLDNDGDQDIYHQVGGAAESDVFHNMLFENPGFKSSWITLDIKGTNSNRSAIGTRIKLCVTDSGTKEFRYIHHAVGSGGSFGANTLRAEIGLGHAAEIDTLWVEWPGKEKEIQIFQDVKSDRFYQLKQGETLSELTLPKFNFLQDQQSHNMAMVATCGSSITD